MTVETITQCKLRFIGEVVETSRGTERCFAKITVRQICVEIPSVNCDTIQLGDTIAFETGIETHTCRPAHSTGGQIFSNLQQGV
jgi:hypothetical protein